jgi:hypothetical protein
VSTLPAPTRAADITIPVGPPIAIGATPQGLRRVVPILGGTITGPCLSGSVLPVGDNDRLIRADGYTTLDARYAARPDDGAMVYVVNTGVRFGPRDVMASITGGKPVDPSQVYVRTSPCFETADPRYVWPTRPMFLATGARHPGRVELMVYEVG